MNAAIITTLIPGSVWSLPRKGRDPSLSTVVLVTNEGASPEHLERFPQQVVFVTESGAVRSQEIEVYTSRRTFHGVNEKMADLISHVVPAALEGDDEADDQTIDFDKLPVPPGAVTEVLVNGDGTQVPSDDLSVAPFTYQAEGELAELLGSNFTRYTEVREGKTTNLHLTFMLDDGLTVESVEAAFGGQTGFEVAYKMGDTATAYSIPAESWTLGATRLEISGSGIPYVVVHLVTSIDQEIAALESVITPPVQEPVVTAQAAPVVSATVAAPASPQVTVTA